MHRAWPFTVKHRIGASNQLRQVLSAQGHGGKRRDRCGHGTLILGLVQAAPPFAQAGGVVDAGNHQHRDRIGVRLANGGSGVGDTRPGDDKTHTGLAADPGITVGHKACALLVAGEDVTNAAAGQAAVQLQGMHPGNTKHRVDAVVGQQAD
ncbi:hypothetical protein D3C80_1056470 [compost metagenome]